MTDYAGPARLRTGPRGGPASHGTDPGPHRLRRTAGAGRAGWLEAAIGATLAGSFLTVPVAVAHLVLGIVFAVLAAAHVVLWRRVYRAVRRR